VPRYDYICKECARELEIEHGIKEDALKHQRHIKRGGRGEPCDGELERLISPSTFLLRGAGWTPKFGG